MTNQEFAEKNQLFKGSCELTGIQPTKRQASKYRNKKGAAFKALSKDLDQTVEEALTEFFNKGRAA